jgi:hypothetical protein
LIWRFGQKLLVSHGEPEHPPSDHHNEPPAQGPPTTKSPPAMSPAAK